MQPYRNINFKQFIQVTIALSFVNAIEGLEGQLCLSCNDVILPSLCDRVTRCGIHEDCFMDKQINKNGRIIYNLGCRDKYLCGSANPFGKRSDISLNYKYALPGVPDVDTRSNTEKFDSLRRSSSSYITLCSACCNATKLCNIDKMCGVAAFNRSGGRLCFACDQQLSTSDCDIIKWCPADKLCQIAERTVNNVRFYQSKCADTNCSSSHGLCSSCCASELCNTECPGQPLVHTTAATTVTTVSKQTAPVILSITQNPSIAHYGETVRLSCNVIGIPKPFVQWDALVSSQVRNISTTGNDLTITALDSTTDTKYKCRASNSAGHDELITHLSVALPTTTVAPDVAPTIESVTISPSRIFIGDDVRLYCLAKGTPTPNIIWDVLASTTSMALTNIHSFGNGAVLEIKNYRLNNNKDYRCTAFNSAGSVSKVVSLHNVSH